jgi:hypothetical protein
VTYAYAQLSDRDLGVLRLSGPGLGNLLVPWARCLIAARRHSLTLVTPTWPQVKIGPLLRREPDKRLYIRVFTPGSDEGHGARKLRLLATAPRMPESALGEGESVRQGAVVVFRGLSSETLLGNDGLVAARLWSITRPAFRAQLSERQVPAIAVHVRLGDFRPRQPGDPPLANTRIGLDWYVEKLLGLRAAVGEETLAVLFSDGDDGELEPLLRLPRCRRGAYGAAISGSAGDESVLGTRCLALVFQHVRRVSRTGSNDLAADDDSAYAAAGSSCGDRVPGGAGAPARLSRRSAPAARRRLRRTTVLSSWAPCSRGVG